MLAPFSASSGTWWLCQCQDGTQNFPFLPPQLRASRVNCADEIPAAESQGHLHTAAAYAAGSDDRAGKTASDDIVSLDVKLPSEPGTISSDLPVPENSIAKFSSHSRSRFD